MTSGALSPLSEAVERFPCFGGTCAVLVQGAGPGGSTAEAAARARRRLEQWHTQFSRFDAGSELSRLNADRRQTVPVSPVMARLVEVSLRIAAATGGLVDPTLVTELEHAGYARDRRGMPVPLSYALRWAAPRRPAGPSPQARWQAFSVDREAGTVTRPPGIRLDSGGIAKGLFGDLLAEVLDGHASFAIEAAGDVRLGGSSGIPRSVHVAGPFDGSVAHTFELAAGAAATSGISKRSWLDHGGRPAHHLLDPATGTPAYTGIVQVTALAPTGVKAEALSKAALLSGPACAPARLVHGGLIVFDDGSSAIVDARTPEGAR